MLDWQRQQQQPFSIETRVFDVRMVLILVFSLYNRSKSTKHIRLMPNSWERNKNKLNYHWIYRGPNTSLARNRIWNYCVYKWRSTNGTCAIFANTLYTHVPNPSNTRCRASAGVPELNSSMRATVINTYAEPFAILTPRPPSTETQTQF